MNKNLLEEIDLLLQFNVNSLQQGIKIHSSANDTVKTAASRLFDKGLITQNDGGYLTDLGIEAMDHCQHLLGILKS